MQCPHSRRLTSQHTFLFIVDPRHKDKVTCFHLVWSRQSDGQSVKLESCEHSVHCVSYYFIRVLSTCNAYTHTEIQPGCCSPYRPGSMVQL